MASGPLDSFNLTGKTVLVTGASAGLGWEFSLRLAKQGANVVVAARRVDRLKALVDEIEALPAKDRIKPGKAKAIQLDVSQPEENIRAAVDQAWDAFGGFDILVNNAGVAEPMMPAMQVKEEDWARTLDINVKGMALVLRSAALKLTEAKRPSSIVNVSSIVGVERGLFPVFAMYSASKAAVSQFTKVLAIELGPHNIRVNALCPGPFPSEMSAPLDEAVKAGAPTVFPLGRPGVTDPDLTGPLLFLVSDASAYVTGTNIIVDGGYTLGMRPLV